ncbi:peptidyl serine alpha-galactosyltransferase [Olea europaea var. sylvestris]|nr:peptidyl serine alpha-galactosyltransferase [Olea europaea var. sylvestris]
MGVERIAVLGVVVVVTMVMGSAWVIAQEAAVAGREAPWRIHTLFSVECQNYFDWQTVGLMHSYRKARQPGPITRLLSCTEEEKKSYRGMELAPTFEVPSMSTHPKTGDWYPAINKPAGVFHWLKHSKEAQNVDWVVILDADMIIRGPIIPWELGAEKGRPVAAYYGYLIGCDNDLAKLHTKHPELCDKVGGLLAMHIDDLRALAPMWLSKTEEVREDRAHWGTNYTGDIYGTGWISEMYGYSFGAAEVGLRHKINDNLMIYPGYIPRDGIEPILMHYGLPFSVGNWSFSKLEHHEDNIVYDCGRLFPEPPYPREVQGMETDPNKRRALFLNLECINTLNEGLLLQHAAYGCPKPKWSKYLSFLKSKTFAELSQPRSVTPKSLQMMEVEHTQTQEQANDPGTPYPKIHTIFSTECSPYFDWQTVGLVHSFHLSGQPGNITRLLSCTEEDLKQYKGHDLAPTHYVPSMSRHPLTGDWYPAINKPAAVLHWLNHAKIDAEYIVILDADMIIRGPITPWEFNAARGRPVSTPYDYLIGCDNDLAKMHTRHPDACNKVGGVIIMHINDLRRFALLWLHKTEEVRADTAHWSRNITGDVYESGWISEMYGYSFGAAELNLHHIISNEILIYPGYVPAPGVKYRVFHYGLEFSVGNWSFDKAKWRSADLVNKCWAKFPEPPDPSTLDRTDENALQRDLLSIECGNALNEALRLHHEKKKCPDPTSISSPVRESPDSILLSPPNQETASEVTTSRKFGKIEEISTLIRSPDLKNKSRELSQPAMAKETFTSMRFWIIGLWAFSIFVFITVMSVMLSSRKGQKKKGRSFKTKRRASHSGIWEPIGNDRHLRSAEIA